MEKTVSPAECQSLIQITKDLESSYGDVQVKPSPYISFHRINDKTVEFDEVADDRVHKAMYYSIPLKHPINEKLWIIGSDFAFDNKYEFTHCTGANILKYEDDGGHFGWHVDGHNKHDGFSLTMQLSDPSDYEGGIIQFGEDKTGANRTVADDVYKDWELTQKSVKPVHSGLTGQGDCIIYDAFIYHRVTPVTKGTRYALLAFFRNYPEYKGQNLDWASSSQKFKERDDEGNLINHNYPWTGKKKK